MHENDHNILPQKLREGITCPSTNHLLNKNVKIETISINDKSVTSTLNPDDKATLFLRWDNTYVFENYPQGKTYGIYKVHAHKPEIQMVNYGDKPQFQFYQFSIDKNNLILKSTDQKTKLELKRIYQFLK